MSLLEKINSPADLKALSLKELPALAEEIRNLIVGTVMHNGGHMASNLGVVELTIALHRVFDSPHDRIIFDISHQSYPHKILTGRARNFASIRTSGGYSGYFEPQESPHDVLALGHAGCGPSLALGLAVGEKMKAGDGYIVCVIGDGGLTTGLAYEGLSNIIHHSPRNLMVILNDNGMAISPNVGWLARWRGEWLPRLRAQLELDRDFQKFEEVTEALAPKVPLGPMFLDLGKGLKSAIQKSLIPGVGQVWDEMGFNYIGPADGHNIAELIETISRARQYSDKVPFIHVLTNKGQGYNPATQDPVRFHQPGPPATGEKRPTYSQVFAAILGDLMDQDKRIVAISAAMLEGTALAVLKPQFPDRIFDVGICEQHAVSMAAGMARSGLKPVVCIYSTFLQRAFDQIVHDVCLNDLPVVFALDRAGIVGQDGKTHHGLFDLAYMRIPPNMIVAVPRDPNEMQSLLYTALQQNHPFSIRYPRGEVPIWPLDMKPKLINIGESERMHFGSQIGLIALGEEVAPAAEAADILASEGIDVWVSDLRFIKPIDEGLVYMLTAAFRDVLVIEEGTAVAGAAAALLEAMSQLNRRIPRVHQLSLGDNFPDHGETEELRHLYGLDTEAIVAKVHSINQGGE